MAEKLALVRIEFLKPPATSDQSPALVLAEPPAIVARFPVSKLLWPILSHLAVTAPATFKLLAATVPMKPASPPSKATLLERFSGGMVPTIPLAGTEPAIAAASALLALPEKIA